MGSAHTVHVVGVAGVRDCLGALQTVRESVGTRVVRGAVMKRASEVNKFAKAGLRRSRTGGMRKAVGVKRLKSRKPYQAAAVVGPRKGFRVDVGPDGRPYDPASVAHLVEAGRKAVTATNAKVLAAAPKGIPFRNAGRFAAPFRPQFFGKTVRSVAGIYFMRAAYRTAAVGWRARMREDIRAGVELAARSARNRVNPFGSSKAFGPRAAGFDAGAFKGF